MMPESKGILTKHYITSEVKYKKCTNGVQDWRLL